MIRKLGVLALVVGVLGLAGCASTQEKQAKTNRNLLVEMSTVQPSDPTHDCESFWKPTSDELLTLLQAENQGNRGWALKLKSESGSAVRQAMKNLEMEFCTALGEVQGSCKKAEPQVDPTDSQRLIGEKCVELLARLDGDCWSGFHADPDAPGWLKRPNGGNPEAVQKALQVWAALKEGLDM